MKKLDIRNMTAAEWNAEVPLGSLVHFYPVAGRPEFEARRTRSEAWTLGSDEVVVKIEGRAGGVSTRHCQIMGPPEAMIEETNPIVEIDPDRFPDGIHSETINVANGWAVETFPASTGGYWFRIVRADLPAYGCPRRAVAQEVGVAAAGSIGASETT